MKALTQAQKDELKSWVEAKISLSDIQKKIFEEFGQTITYMDLKFLIDDLEIELVEDKPEAVEAKGASEPEVAEPTEVFDESGNAIGGSGQFEFETDRVTRPGTMTSGTVTFSDGEQATWYLDQMGRIGLAAKTEGYRPSESDMERFQTSLQHAIQGATGI